MSNMLLRQMRAQGLVKGLVFPFARARPACDAALRANRVVMLVEDALSAGTFWVMSEEDAQRLETMGYVRYTAKPEQPDDESGD